MKKMLIVMSSVILVSMLVMGCTSDRPETKENTVEELLAYKDTYVGDSSAVVNMSYLLPGGKYVKRVSLQTNEKPYEISIDYGIKEDSGVKEKDLEKYWDDEVTKRAFLNNATTYFILVQNVDVVEFVLHTSEKKSFRVTREEIDAFYGKDVRTFAESEKNWEKDVMEKTVGDDEKVNAFFKDHPIQSK